MAALKVALLVACCEKHTQYLSFFLPFLFIFTNFDLWNPF